MMEVEELPAGWETAELSEVCLVNPTINKSSIADDLAVSFVPMPAVEAESGGIDVSAMRKFGEVKKGYTPFREGDVLFAKITPCMENGKMAVVPALHNGLGFGSTEFHVLRAHPGISPQFVYYFVSSRTFRRVAEHNMSGAVGQRRVTTPYLSACKIPVPPTAEQHRIVAKIEELFSELDQGVDSLKTAREQLKVYRQSLLKNAFEGKLTAAWRAAHRDQLETATALQQRIARERQARYQQQLAEWQTAGQAGPKPNPPKPLPPLTAEELAGLPELPAGWGWVSVSQLLAEELCNGKSVKDRKGGFPVLRLNALGDGKIDLSIQKEGAWTATEAKNYVVEVGDFLVSRGNGSKHLVGRGGFVSALNGMLVAFPDTMIRIRLMRQLVDFRYFGLCWDSMLVRSQIENTARTTAGIYKINQELMEAYKIPLPTTLEEQLLIVRELESKLSEADQLDQTLATALQQADALRQSILKKAFCGQLVEQDKNEEPATALLERIRATQHLSAKRSSRSSPK